MLIFEAQLSSGGFDHSVSQQLQISLLLDENLDLISIAHDKEITFASGKFVHCLEIVISFFQTTAVPDDK